MNISDRLYVEIVPFEGERSPQPHPIRDAHFDSRCLYKVLGMYNASETSECYFVLANPERQIWFISQRHLRAWGLRDGAELFIAKGDFPLGAGAANGGVRFAGGTSAHSVHPDRVVSLANSLRNPSRLPSS